MIQKKLGWLPQKPDPRDIKFSVELLKPIQTVLLSDKYVLPTPYDQGQLGSCFAGETKIKLLDGTIKTLKELYENGKDFYVYSADENGSLTAGKARANLTGKNKEVVEVTLDNGAKIICTPDHEFMMRDGSFKRVIDIMPNESLMPNYLKVGPLGYEQYFDNNLNKWKYVHTTINEKINLGYKKIVKERIEEKSDKYLVTHHKNFNKFDNTPDNLEWMGENEHKIFHNTSWNGTDAQREHSRKIMQERYEKNPEWNLENCSKGGKMAWEKAKNEPKRLEQIKNNLLIGHTKESRDKANKTLKNTLKNPEIKERQIINGKKVMANLLSNDFNKEKYINLGKTYLGKNTTKKLLVKWAKELIDENKEINEKNWLEKKESSGIHNFYKFTTIEKFFNSIEELEESAINYNHKIVNIKKLDKKIDVYCLTVDKYHNFALESGVFVHNCTANSLAFLVHFDLLNKHTTLNQTPFQPSRLFIYYFERLMEGTVNSDAGAVIRDGIKVIAQNGVSSEDLWPYNINQFTIKPSDEAINSAKQFEALQYKSIDNTNKQLLVNALLQGFPISCGISVFESFMSQEVAQTGIVPMPDINTESMVGGHAIAVVGYIKEEDMFMMRNSWGTNWGLGGYFKIPASYLCSSDYASDFWTISLIK
jgi:C1A family cysteine protease